MKTDGRISNQEQKSFIYLITSTSATVQQSIFTDCIIDVLCKESKTKYYDVELFGLTAGMGIIVPRMLFSCLRSLQLHTALNNERPQKTERGQSLTLSSISTQINNEYSSSNM